MSSGLQVDRIWLCDLPDLDYFLSPVEIGPFRVSISVTGCLGKLFPFKKSANLSRFLSCLPSWRKWSFSFSFFFPIMMVTSTLLFFILSVWAFCLP